jgi:hypothetical protein
MGLHHPIVKGMIVRKVVVRAAAGERFPLRVRESGFGLAYS